MSLGAEDWDMCHSAPPWESGYVPQAAEHIREHEGTSWTCCLSVAPASCAQEGSGNVPGLQIEAVWVFGCP